MSMSHNSCRCPNPPWLLKTNHFQQTWGSCYLGSVIKNRIREPIQTCLAHPARSMVWILETCAPVFGPFGAPKAPGDTITEPMGGLAMSSVIGMTFIDLNLKEVTMELWGTHDLCGKNQPSSASREWNMATLGSIFFLSLNLDIAWHLCLPGASRLQVW